MNSAADPDAVLQDLGDKFAEALVESVEAARADLDAFRAWQPGWFPSFTSRVTANFLHERLWAALVSRVDDLDHVDVLDREPRRELYSSTYVLRVKRHHVGDRISAYPTAGALKFWSSELTLPGLESVSLALGYMWDADLREVGDAVISFRNALDKPVWAIALTRGAGGATGITWAPVDPSLPDFDLSQVIDQPPAAEGGDAT